MDKNATEFKSAEIPAVQAREIADPLVRPVKMASSQLLHQVQEP